MKYFKRFEDIKVEPKVGDYVVCEDKSVDFDKTYENDAIFDYFLSSNIGVIKDIRTNESVAYPYIVNFEFLPKNLKHMTNTGTGSDIVFKRVEIIYFSENKEDLEHIINSNKYNL